jgi:hypothetical protein
MSWTTHKYYLTRGNNFDKMNCERYSQKGIKKMAENKEKYLYKTNSTSIKDFY